MSGMDGFLQRLTGGTAELLRRADWRASPLGAVEGWSDALKQSVGMMMASGFPMSVRWGPELISLYNDAYIDILGEKHPEAFGRPAREVWPEIYRKLGPILADVMSGTRGAFFARDHLWRVRRYGHRFEDARFTISYSPIPDPTVPNGIGGILVTVLETTNRYRGERTLRSRNKALADEVARRTRERDRIWQVSEDLLGVSNFEGYFLSVNPAWTVLLGWSEEEIKRLHVSELRHPHDAAHSNAGRERLAANAGTVRVENRFRHKDGSWRWLSWTMTADDGLIYVIGRHVTAQREAAEKLRESELHFRLLVDGVTEYAIYMLDSNGIVSSWNSGAQRIKGYSTQEILGQHFSRFYTEADRALGVPERALARAVDRSPYQAEGWRVRKDGSQFWAHATLSAIRDASGEVIGFAKVTRDATERRQAQEALQHAQERLAQSEKLETLGQFTGAIAHDFNNMLMIVSGNTQIIRRRLVDPAALRAVKAIELAAARGENLTRRLLTFSRRQALNPIVIDLRERLMVLHDILVSSTRENIKLVYDIAEELWPVKVDVPELEMALVNIVVNARDAMVGGGIVQLSAANVTVTPADGISELNGDYVSLAISDTGTGIEPAILQRVFEPFFTTKGPSMGTGLGLSQVYGFARQSNGLVLIASTPGAGTTVTLYLPRASTGEMESAESGAEEEARGRDEKILLVEDNPDVQGVTASLLEELGYRVQLADNAADALNQLAANADFSLVFSDIVMPGPMNGIALAHRVREAYPHIAVLLTTGYAPREDTAAGRLPILRKPYRIGTLSSVLRETIERARANRH